MSKTYLFRTSSSKSSLHTYRFRFNNGSEFKTNATALNYALSNLHTTFSDSQILERGGLVCEEEEQQEESKPKRYTLASVARHVRIPVKILRDWIRLSYVNAEWSDSRGTVMTEEQVKDVIEFKRKCEDMQI